MLDKKYSFFSQDKALSLFPTRDTFASDYAIAAMATLFQSPITVYALSDSNIPLKHTLIVIYDLFYLCVLCYRLPYICVEHIRYMRGGFSVCGRRFKIP